MANGNGANRLRRAKAFARWHLVGVHTTSGRIFDIALILVIAIGVLALILESVPSIAREHETALVVVEAIVGTVFVLEYALRFWVAPKKLAYVLSFWGLIDLLAIVPFLFRGFGFAYLRTLRVLRIFSILKIGKYTHASRMLVDSLMASRSKIGVFLLSVLVLVLVLSFTMHALEPESFPTVPDAIWWTIVTVTTVGYGDFVPHSLLGRMLASAAMITAFGIIAVPTGIVAAEYGDVRAGRRKETCKECGRDSHDTDALYCAGCGTELPGRRGPRAQIQ
jgi:voltage-gated potassium channel